MIGTHKPAIVSASQEPAAEATANGRKALPEVMGTGASTICVLFSHYSFSCMPFVLKSGNFVGYFCDELSSSIFSLELATKSPCKYAIRTIPHA
jgi:hypothetical protein